MAELTSLSDLDVESARLVRSAFSQQSRDRSAPAQAPLGVDVDFRKPC